MYKSRFKRWGLQKYFRESEVHAIARAKLKRDAVGKSSEIKKRGRVVDFARFKRHLERKGQIHLLQQGPSASLQDSDIKDWEFCIMTPPPYIQSPEIMKETEKMLSFLRTWIDGNFDAGVWKISRTDGAIFCPRTNGLSRMSPFMHYTLYEFATCFFEGRNLLHSPGSARRCNQLLNLAFGEIRYMLEADQPEMLLGLIRAVLLPRCESEESYQLHRMFWSYASELASIIRGSNHPFFGILQSFRKANDLRTAYDTFSLFTEMSTEYTKNYAETDDISGLILQIECITIRELSKYHLHVDLSDGKHGAVDSGTVTHSTLFNRHYFRTQSVLAQRKGKGGWSYYWVCEP